VKAEEWSLEQLRRMRISNAHTESWGEFGMAWQQVGTSLQMIAPSTAVILAEATPFAVGEGRLTTRLLASTRVSKPQAFRCAEGFYGYYIRGVPFRFQSVATTKILNVFSSAVEPSLQPYSFGEVLWM
jgi:hypothetical protein